MNRPQRDAELSAGGWERRFIGAPPRLGESVELYESLGLAVLSAPVTDEELADELSVRPLPFH